MGAINTNKRFFLLIFLLLNLISYPVQCQNFLFPLKLTYQRIPLLSIKHICSDLLFDLVLDTGSSQISLSDQSCSQCITKYSVCPHIKQSTLQINYLSVTIQGQFSFLQICGIRFKFFCVRKSKGYQFAEAHGILGLSGNKTGAQFLRIFFKQFLRTNEVQFSFYLGLHQHKLIIGKIPHYYVKEKVLQFSYAQLRTQPIQEQQKQQSQIKEKTRDNYQAQKNWKIQLCEILLQQKQIYNEQITLTFDSGSSVLVFPISIFNQIFLIFQNISFQQCSVKQNKIYCPLQFYQKIPNIIFKVNKYQNNTKLFLSKREFVSINPVNDFQIVFKIVNQTDQHLQNTIIGGIPFFQKYIFTFNLNQSGALVIYQSNKQSLILQQLKNIKMFLFMYAFILILSTFTIVKTVQFIKDSINRKIII